MKKILLAALLAAGVVPAVSAGRAKVTLDTLVVSTDPQMHCSSCENRIKEKIRFVKGTKKISASAAKQEVTIVYDKSKFISVGGFDYSITSPHWQLLDFSLRSWLWGEKIIASTSYKFYYQGQEPVADVTIDDSYFRFFLKNIAINKKIDYAYLPVRTFITFHRNSNYSFGPALSEFRNVRRWVYQNKYRYKTEIKKLTETWDEDVQ